MGDVTAAMVLGGVWSELMTDRLLPRPGSVHRRRIVELVDDGCVTCHSDHAECLTVGAAASWPRPDPFADLDYHTGED